MIPFSLVLVTAPNVRTARTIARECLKARLAACVNIVPGVESHYWWQGKLEKGSESLLLIKTRSQLLPQLEKVILHKHPYETPEFVAIELRTGSRKYLQWLARETEPRAKANRGACC